MRSQEAKKPRSREQRTISRRISRRTILDFSTSWFLGFLVSWLLGISPAFAGPSPAPASASRVPAPGLSAPSPFLNVGRLGEWAAQAALREGHLLSHLRGIDPFGITIRGPYKGLPPVAEHPAEKPNLAVAAAKIPTLEKAVQALPIGGVNARGREILVGSRSIHEGDLLVLESGGSPFVVWVQSVEERGVLFCDIDLQKHILRPVGSAPKGLPVAAAPKELPGDPAYGIPDISHFLNKDAQQ
jgi:hypothetical protein